MNATSDGDRYRVLDARKGSDLRRRNAALILRALREQGPMPRVDLAAALALSSGGVTRLTAELADHGLLRELEPLATAEVGRRRIPVDVCAERFVVAGVHIGREYTTCGLVDLRGQVVVGPREVVHAKTDPAFVADEIVEAVGELIAARTESSHVIGTGISSGALVETSSGTVVDHEALGWHNVDLAGAIGDRLDGVLTVESTYRAMATAEMWYGVARDTRSFVHLFIGHVVGSALVVDGAPYGGVGMRAGEVAHLPVTRQSLTPCACGRTGCLTSVAGNYATIERARMAGLDAKSVTDVAEFATRGDPVAVRVLGERAETIGEAVGLIIDVLAPEKVVVAGAVLLTDDDLPRLRETVGKTATHSIDPESAVVATALGGRASANVVASATPALKLFYDDPLGYVAGLPATAETAQ